MDENPYIIPDDGFKRTINFSGGRSSAYMLAKIVEAHGGELPPDVAVVFCNTGKEREATLLFVQQVATWLQIPVVWLEYRYRTEAKGGRKDPKNTYRKVDYMTASRNGEPFDTLIEKAHILPNVKTRKCTAELKVETTRRYCLHDLKWQKRNTKRVIGYRFDEKHRWEPALMGPKEPKKGKTTCDLEFPMVYAGVEKWDVNHFWKNAPFDLGIHSARGNCDLCFLKGVENLVNTIREEPKRADWWISKERDSLKAWGGKLQKKEMVRFSKRWSYEELRDMALKTPELNLGIFKDGDEEADESVACFCSD